MVQGATHLCLYRDRHRGFGTSLEWRNYGTQGVQDDKFHIVTVWQGPIVISRCSNSGFIRDWKANEKDGRGVDSESYFAENIADNRIGLDESRIEVN